MNFAERAARNEEVLREVNLKIEEGAEMHGVTAPMPFHCECGQPECLEKIDLIPSEYERILSEKYRFAVVPAHAQSVIERVVEDHGEFVVVEKVGEAREQIDEDHPQQRHCQS
jgi:hypothetical protein